MLWLITKILLSTVCFLFGAIAAFLSWSSGDYIPGGVFLLFFLFVGSWPWINFNQPGLGFILFLAGWGVMYLFQGLYIFNGFDTFPKVCKGKYSFFCVLENSFYIYGGDLAASIPNLTISLSIFFFAWKVHRKIHKYSGYTFRE